MNETRLRQKSFFYCMYNLRNQPSLVHDTMFFANANDNVQENITTIVFSTEIPCLKTLFE